MHVVWFKRDLRLADHAPLIEARSDGAPVLPLYVVEPSLWRGKDASGRHYGFVVDCLTELDRDLAARGSRLVIRVGEVIDVLAELHERLRFTALWSHEETGNALTYARDRAVARFCRARGVRWEQRPQTGVIRGLQDRDGWARTWERRMAPAPRPAPRALPPVSASIASDPIPSPAALGLAPDPCPDRQRGGRTAGLALLSSFLGERGLTYSRAMSRPGAGAEACSRLSPHLAYGTVSIREAHHAARDRYRSLVGDPAPDAASWRRAMRSFEARLHWHCHFMQKLESEPRLEFENTARAYDGLREGEVDPGRLAAWTEGRTGLPLLDACMRSLAATGWLNFRMRAMVMSVASYQLWLHWRPTGLVLARLFTDYEPGIHWCQAQMQSGVTGINTLRIYNPVKQSFDQDPSGAFIRRWLPELSHLEAPAVHEPWKHGGVRGYPEPIVELAEATRSARERIWTIRRTGQAQREADDIQERLGSRKSGLAPVRRPSRRAREDAQLKLGLVDEP